MTLTYDQKPRTRAEAQSTLTLMGFVVVAIVFMSVALSESVERQLLRPTEIIQGTIFMKVGEAYNALRKLGEFAVRPRAFPPSWCRVRPRRLAAPTLQS